MGRSYVVIRTSFEALHAWPECPYKSVDFLKSSHRHVFHVEMKIRTDGDRQIELILLKRNVDIFICAEFKGKDLGRTSCEVLARKLAEEFNADSVSVFEDAENGAIYET